jgi:chromosome segregation ATPase
MVHQGKKAGGRTFKKRAHRPWNTKLLETTVDEATISLDDDLFSFDIDLDIDLDAEPTIDDGSFYPEFNFTDEALDSDVNLGNIALDDQNIEIKNQIMQTKQQKQMLMQQIGDKSTNQILLGGFFQPQQIHANNDTQHGRRINSLLSDLKDREQKLSSLTSSLKISAAYDRAEQAELTKQATAHQLQIAEQRMRKAVEQANMAEEQFMTAMEQAKQAAMAHQEEVRLRTAAEANAKEAKLRANAAEVELQNERLARLSADEKAQHAIALAEKASQIQSQLHESIDKVSKLEANLIAAEAKRDDAQARYEELNTSYQKIVHEHRECSEKIYKLETSIQTITNEHKDNDKLIADFNNQREKLKAIIVAEQDLRKIAERKLNDALDRAQKAEQGWQQEIQQRKIIEERAKRAVAHASRTVMHLLNAPADEAFGMQVNETKAPLSAQAKPKIKVPASTNGIEEFDYEEDDLLF